MPNCQLTFSYKALGNNGQERSLANFFGPDRARGSHGREFLWRDVCIWSRTMAAWDQDGRVEWNRGKRSALDDVDFHGFNADSQAGHPFDGCFDVVPLAFKLEAHDAYFIRDAGLSYVGDHFEFLTKLPDDRSGDQSGRVHQPKSGLLGVSRRLVWVLGGFALGRLHASVWIGFWNSKSARLHLLIAGHDVSGKFPVGRRKWGSDA